MNARDELEQEYKPDDFEWAPVREKETAAVNEGRPYRKDVQRAFFRNKAAVAGLVIIAVVALMAIIGPYMSRYTYSEQRIENQNLPPRMPFLESLGILDGSEKVRLASGEHRVNRYKNADTYYWFGSDSLGRDIFARTWMGTRISLYIALVAVLIDLLVGMTYGMVSGYCGGRVDQVMQRVTEVLNGIPTLVVVTLLIMAWRPGILAITVGLALTGWIGMSRIARAQVLVLKEQEFVLAAKTLGAGRAAVLLREILPNVMGQLVVVSMFSVPNAIFTEAFLAFIGLGVPVPLASLGTLISDAFRSLTVHPYMIVPPVAVLAAVMLSFNLVADGLRDALDPRRAVSGGRS